MEAEYDEWESRVREELIPKLDDSAAVVSIVPKGKTDVKFAVELGLAIMMDKPILALVTPGSVVPAKLVAVADRVLVVDLTRADASRVIGEAVNELLNGR